MIPARDLARAVAPVIEAIAWQPDGHQNHKRHPRGCLGYKATMGLKVWPRPDNTRYLFTLPDAAPEDGSHLVLIEVQNVEVTDVADPIFGKETITAKKEKSSVDIDLDNLEGLTTLHREFTKTFTNGKSETEEVKNGIETALKVTGSKGPVEVEVSSKYTREWGKQTGRSEDETVQDTVSVDAVRHTHMQGKFKWEELSVEREVSGKTRLNFWIRIGRGTVADLGGQIAWFWGKGSGINKRKKYGVQYESITDMVAIIEGRGDPESDEYRWYFDDTKRRPPRKIVDPIRDLPGLPLKYTAKYPRRHSLSGKPVLVRDERTPEEKAADIGR